MLACLIIFGKVEQSLFPRKDVVSIPYVVVCTSGSYKSLPCLRSLALTLIVNSNFLVGLVHVHQNIDHVCPRNWQMKVSGVDTSRHISDESSGKASDNIDILYINYIPSVIISEQYMQCVIYIH